MERAVEILRWWWSPPQRIALIERMFVQQQEEIDALEAMVSEFDVKGERVEQGE